MAIVATQNRDSALAFLRDEHQRTLAALHATIHQLKEQNAELSLSVALGNDALPALSPDTHAREELAQAKAEREQWAARCAACERDLAAARSTIDEKDRQMLSLQALLEQQHGRAGQLEADLHSVLADHSAAAAQVSELTAIVAKKSSDMALLTVELHKARQQQQQQQQQPSLGERLAVVRELPATANALAAPDVAFLGSLFISPTRSLPLPPSMPRPQIVREHPRRRIMCSPEGLTLLPAASSSAISTAATASLSSPTEESITEMLPHGTSDASAPTTPSPRHRRLPTAPTSSPRSQPMGQPLRQRPSVPDHPQTLSLARAVRASEVQEAQALRRLLATDKHSSPYPPVTPSPSHKQAHPPST